MQLIQVAIPIANSAGWLMQSILEYCHRSHFGKTANAVNSEGPPTRSIQENCHRSSFAGKILSVANVLE